MPAALPSAAPSALPRTRASRRGPARTAGRAVLRLLLAGTTAVGLGACGGRSTSATDGEGVYRAVCQTCHGAEGQGVPGAFPPLAGSAWTTGDPGRAVRIVLHGLAGPATRGGTAYDGRMPAHDRLSDAQIAAVLTYVRTHFGNSAPPIDSATVAAVRAADGVRTAPLTTAEAERATGTTSTGTTATDTTAAGSR